VLGDELCVYGADPDRRNAARLALSGVLLRRDPRWTNSVDSDDSISGGAVVSQRADADGTCQENHQNVSGLVHRLTAPGKGTKCGIRGAWRAAPDREAQAARLARGRCSSDSEFSGIAKPRNGDRRYSHQG